MRRHLAVAIGLALVACVLPQAHGRQAPAPHRQEDAAPAPASPGRTWQSFTASLSATGRRETLPVEHGRTAITLRVSGSLVVTTGEGLGRGFRAEFIGFDDGGGTGAARAVWIDEAGDRIFSRMVGTEIQAGRRTMATITGGTGRYAGITGTYAFTWQYLLPGEQGVIQVRLASLSGRYRRESPR